MVVIPARDRMNNDGLDLLQSGFHERCGQKQQHLDPSEMGSAAADTNPDVSTTAGSWPIRSVGEELSHVLQFVLRSAMGTTNCTVPAVRGTLVGGRSCCHRCPSHADKPVPRRRTAWNNRHRHLWWQFYDVAGQGLGSWGRSGCHGRFRKTGSDDSRRSGCRPNLGSLVQPGRGLDFPAVSDRISERAQRDRAQ